MNLQRICRELGRKVDRLEFGPPVQYVYNPLIYARTPLNIYLSRYARAGCEVLMVGMNPGPWGMAQTGIPFGDILMVRDWLGIAAPVGRPSLEHPKRPVAGFDCPRREVSGQRLWGWAQKRFGNPESFFSRFFIWNHCPLLFLEANGRSRTPDKLPKAERESLFALCDQALRSVTRALDPGIVLGIGAFAEGRSREALHGLPVRVASILHPSPASPKANRGWAVQIEKQLKKIGVLIPYQDFTILT